MRNCNSHPQLIQAQWFFFDLDDTLHSFRKASSAATTETLQLILASNPTATASLLDLQSSYRSILKLRTQAAFVDGKTSHLYREERFRILLEEYEMKADQDVMIRLLACYEKTLTANLMLKPHALELWKSLESRGKKIAIITEGPQDAQERTIDALGLASYVDHLATTNKYGIAKTDGLYPRVLKSLGLRAEEVVTVGDSWERDIVPARRAGICAVWFNEHDQAAQDRESDVLEVKSLEELNSIMCTL
jgi:putative hydrolase of the HAD superfamily